MIIFSKKQTTDLINSGRTIGHGRTIGGVAYAGGTFNHELYDRALFMKNAYRKPKEDSTSSGGGKGPIIKGNTGDNDSGTTTGSGGGGGGGGGGTGNSNTKKDKSKTVFDWIEKRLAHLSNITEELANSINDWIDANKKAAKTREQLTALEREASNSFTAADLYSRKAKQVSTKFEYTDDSGKTQVINLSKLTDSNGKPLDYVKKVQEGLIESAAKSLPDFDTSTAENKAIADAIDTYADWWNKSVDASKAVQDKMNEQLDAYEALVSIPTEKAEKKIDKLASDYAKINSVADVAANGESGMNVARKYIAKGSNANLFKNGAPAYATQNALLDMQRNEAYGTMTARQNAEKEAQENLENAEAAYNKLNAKVQKQGNKASDYSKKLLENYAQRMVIAQNAVNEATQAAREAEGEYANTLLANEKAKFDNIKEYYDDILSYYESITSLNEKNRNLANYAATSMSTKEYQQALKDNATETDAIKDEPAKLRNQLNSSIRKGIIVKDSKEYREAMAEINAAEEALVDKREERIKLFEEWISAPIQKAQEALDKIARDNAIKNAAKDLAASGGAGIQKALDMWGSDSGLKSKGYNTYQNQNRLVNATTQQYKDEMGVQQEAVNTTKARLDAEKQALNAMIKSKKTGAELQDQRTCHQSIQSGIAVSH